MCCSLSRTLISISSNFLIIFLSLAGGGDDDSESDSEASVQPVRDSMSLASSHSSDDEDGDFGDWKKIPRNESKMPGVWNDTFKVSTKLFLEVCFVNKLVNNVIFSTAYVCWEYFLWLVKGNCKEQILQILE